MQYSLNHIFIKLDIWMKNEEDEHASRLTYKPYMTASARKSDKVIRQIASFIR